LAENEANDDLTEQLD